MPILAATTLEHLQQVPPRVWWTVALVIVGFIVVVVLIRRAAQMSKLLLGGLLLFVVIMVGMQWVYQRDEPAWATPVVDWLAGTGFLPTTPKPPSHPAK